MGPRWPSVSMWLRAGSICLFEGGLKPGWRFHWLQSGWFIFFLFCFFLSFSFYIFQVIGYGHVWRCRRWRVAGNESFNISDDCFSCHRPLATGISPLPLPLLLHFYFFSPIRLVTCPDFISGNAISEFRLWGRFNERPSCLRPRCFPTNFVPIIHVFFYWNFVWKTLKNIYRMTKLLPMNWLAVNRQLKSNPHSYRSCCQLHWQFEAHCSSIQLKMLKRFIGTLYGKLSITIQKGKNAYEMADWP